MYSTPHSLFTPVEIGVYQYTSTSVRIVSREGTSSRSRRPVAGATGGWLPNQCINHPDFSQDAKIDCELWSHSASPTNNRCHYFTPPPPPPTYPTLVWFCILHSNEVQIFYRPQGNSARWEYMYLLTHLEEIYIVRSPSLIFDHKRRLFILILY